MLEVINMDVAYGDVQVLWDINIKIKAGEMVALIGSNGAGKTSALKAISGLIKVKKGSIIFNGNNIENIKPPLIAKAGLTQVPEGRQIFDDMSVMENLEMGGYILENKEERKENIEKMLTVFPILKQRKKQHAGTLSGGEQQMLAIARSIISNPKMVMLDEPSLGLAPRLVSIIFDTIKKLREEIGLTVLIVEQDVKKALSIAERGYVFENGRIVHSGTSKELINDPDIKQMYLGL